MTPEEEIQKAEPILEKKVELAGLEVGEGGEELALEEARQTIFNYCGIDKMPEGLMYIWASMALDILIFYAQLQASMAELQGAGGAEGEGTEESGDETVLTSVGLSGISIGFSQKTKKDVNWASGAAMGGTSTLDKDKLVQNYQQQLIAYRQLRW